MVVCVVRASNAVHRDIEHVHVSEKNYYYKPKSYLIKSHFMKLHMLLIPIIIVIYPVIKTSMIASL